jgi:SAM-dependent methyltransferase
MNERKITSVDDLKHPLFMVAQLPFNVQETVSLNTPMIQIMDDDANAVLSVVNLKELGLYKKILSSNSVFLEIGCGSGYLLEHLTEKGTGTYMGIEPITSEYQKALKRLTPMSTSEDVTSLIQNCIIEDADIKENSLDFIYSYHVFEHIENPLVMFDCAKKWLKEDGILIITCPNVEGYFPRKDITSWRCAISSHRWLPGKSTMKRALKENGFIIDSFLTYGGYPAPRNIFKDIFNKWLKIRDLGDILCVSAKKD